MPVLNVLTSIFIMTALYGIGRYRFQVIIGLAALVIAPVLFGIIDGTDGLIYSLAGAGAALFLTIPLLLLGYLSRNDVIVSVALGGTLGAVHYAIAFCIATALLSIQRMFRLESPAPDSGAASDAAPQGVKLLAFDEQSALVEIEALRMLRRDERDYFGPLYAADHPGAAIDGAPAWPASALPWCAKLAVATLAVLMIGSSM
ncbi:MAG TPA: hypothetical protein VMT60_01090 [Candidatus Bathyarchaeia archaeon]|nr:hypothetical protein [Candidatus Bathyarchaeia archaeon]